MDAIRNSLQKPIGGRSKSALRLQFTKGDKVLMTQKHAINMLKNSRKEGYMRSGATTPISAKPLLRTVRIASVNAKRALLSAGVSALMTGNAL